MKTLQTYNEFNDLNEGWKTNIIGGILMSLITALPSASKAQDLLDPISPTSMTNPASPLYMFDDDDYVKGKESDPFKQSIFRSYRIVKTLEKQDIIANDEYCNSLLDSLNALYDVYNDKNYDDVPKSIRNVNIPMKKFLKYYGNNFNDSTKQVLNRIGSHYDTTSSEQLLIDYNILRSELEIMKKDNNISDWNIQSGAMKAIWIVIAGLLVGVIITLITLVIMTIKNEI